MKKVYIANLNNIKVYKNMPKSFKRYLERYTNDKRYNVSLKAYSLLLTKLQEDFKLDIKNEELILNEFNKPYLKVNKDIYFNISHSKDLIALIISDKECGIDIEYINQDAPLNISNKILSDNELNIYNKEDNKILYLFKVWTIKEAYYKALGVGISLSKLKEECDYSEVKTQLINEGNDKYYVSIDA